MISTAKIIRTLLICAVMNALTFAFSTASLATPLFALRTIGGNPALLDSTIGFNGYNPTNPSFRAEANLGFNSDTGILYGIDTTSSGIETARFDPSFEYEKGMAPVNAGIGTTRTYTTTYHFYGSVAGATDVGNASRRMGVTYDPNMLTAGNAGVVTYANSGGVPNWQEYIAQTASEGIGVLNEGTVGTPVNTSARVTTVTLAHAFGGGFGGGHWHGLEADAFKGQFSTDDGDGSRLISRYFMGKGQNLFKPIIIAHADALRTLEPTATAEGTRTAVLRNKATSSSATNNESVLLTESQFDALVPSISDNGFDLAQNPLNGDLYILSNDGSDAYLSAISPLIPDDSTLATSFTQVDLDPDSAADYVTLSGFHADLAFGAGITFNADASLLYVSVIETTGGAVQAIYALETLAQEETGSVPEPSTAMLLVLGMLALKLRGKRMRA